MALLGEDVKAQLQTALKGLTNPVRLIVFTQEMECQFCRENRQLAEELAQTSEQIKLEVYDFLQDKEQVAQFQVERVPALIVAGEKDYGIRFYGVPAGYEFTSLLNAIQLIGKQDSGLKPLTRERLKTLNQPVRIDVFVTLTCPFCPMMVSLAQRFAFESDRITANAIDAQEFPVLANYYNVMAVPKTLINQIRQIEGAVPEEKLLAEILNFTGSTAVSG